MAQTMACSGDHGRTKLRSDARVKETAFKYLAMVMLATGIALIFGAETCKAAENPGTVSFYFENDLFAHTDQHYTNGVKLSVISPDLTGYAQSGRLPVGVE
jgi:hypothetical protein